MAVGRTCARGDAGRQRVCFEGLGTVWVILHLAHRLHRERDSYEVHSAQVDGTYTTVSSGRRLPVHCDSQDHKGDGQPVHLGMQ